VVCVCVRARACVCACIYIYINDVPPTISTLTEPIIFAEVTSVITSSKKFDTFHTTSNIVLFQISK
jgi:hypothetical protein